MNYIKDICTLNLSLVGCVNENLVSASLGYDDKGKTEIKLVFSKYTEIEEELVEDILADFESMCGHFNISDSQTVYTDKNELPLKFVAYQITTMA